MPHSWKSSTSTISYGGYYPTNPSIPPSTSINEKAKRAAQIDLDAATARALQEHQSGDDSFGSRSGFTTPARSFTPDHRPSTALLQGSVYASPRPGSIVGVSERMDGVNILARQLRNMTSGDNTAHDLALARAIQDVEELDSGNKTVYSRSDSPSPSKSVRPRPASRLNSHYASATSSDTSSWRSSFMSSGASVSSGYDDDAAMARRLAISWKVDSLQQPLHEFASSVKEYRQLQIGAPSMAGSRAPSLYSQGTRSLARTASSSTLATVRSVGTLSSSRSSRNGSGRPVSSIHPATSSRRVSYASSIAESSTGSTVSSRANFTPLENYVEVRKEQRFIKDLRDIFTSVRVCANCGGNMIPPRSRGKTGISQARADAFSPSISALLHICCPFCDANHCRGCFTVHQCGKYCSGGSGCNVGNCCTDILAVAMFEILAQFDAQYKRMTTAAKVSGGRHNRQAYALTALTRPEFISEQWRPNVMYTLVHVNYILSMMVKDDPQNDTIVHLLHLSFLPEVLERLLQERDVDVWMKLDDIYTAVLSLLANMYEVGLHTLLREPLPHIDRSRGIEEWMWDSSRITWGVDGPSLQHKIRELDSIAAQLSKMVSQVSFSHTAQKAESLADAVYYLRIQTLL